MSIPIKTFWLLSSNIDRVSAQMDLRALTVANGSQSGEGSQAVHERLTVEIGEIAKTEANPMANVVRDQQGFDELRSME